MSDIYSARDHLVARYFYPPSRTFQLPGLATMTWGDGGSAGMTLTLPRLADMLPYVPNKRVQGMLQTRTRTKHRSHVHAIGIGGKNGGDEPAVVVYVTKKLPKHELSGDQLVPETVGGVPTDVIESPIPRLADCTNARQRRTRPLVAGVSVGRDGGPSGTLGAFVRSTRPGDPSDAVFLLSNSHVLYTGSGKADGVRVVQPATDDGDAEMVATLRRATKLHVSGPIIADAAIAHVTGSIQVRNEICSLGTIAASAAPVRDMVVEKHGRTSGRTVGRIAAVGLAQEAFDDAGRLLKFTNVFRVEPGPGGEAVARLGDSGSLVLQQGSRAAVGLLFAAEETGMFYLGQPIDDVCQELEIALKLD